MANTFLSAKSPIRSPQLSSIYLHDWWLIKAEGHFNGWRLGVSGFSFREKLGIRVFCSSAITKRHDHVTLESADGITITLSGLINRSNTQEKGFPPEVCSYFLHGFPYNWKEYADQSSCEESINNISANDGTRNTLRISLDELPVTRVRDLLMTTTGPDYCAITETIFNDILGKCIDDFSSSPCEPLVNLDEENTYQETPRKRVRSERKDNGSISVTTPKKRKDPPKTPNQSNVGVENLSSSTRRVATRSMTRAIKFKFENAPPPPPPPVTFIKCSFSESKGSADNNGVISEKSSEPIGARRGR